MGETNPPAAHSNDCPCLQRLPMPLKHLSHQDNTTRRRHVWKAYQPRMWNILHVHKLSKVGINRDQNSVFGRGTFE